LQHNKILFITFDFLEIGEKYSYGIASILSYLKVNNFLNFEIINFDLQNINDINSICNILDNINVQDVRYIAISYYIWSKNFISDIIDFLQKKDFKGDIILGGYEVSSLNKEELLQEHPDCKFFIENYAEKTILNILNNKYSYITKPTFIYDKVDFLEIPSPYIQKVLPITSTVRLETKRGCPFSCAFCSHQDLIDKKYHLLNKDKVYEQLKLFNDLNVKKINIIDPVFNIGSSYIDVLDYIKKINFKGKVSLQVRLDLIRYTENNHFLELCKELNVVLEFGIQTIFENELKAITRKQIKDKAKKIILYCNLNNIEYEISLIYGLPLQTLESFKETIDFFKKINTKHIVAFPLMLLRGTQLYEMKSKYNFKEENFGSYNINHVVSSNSYTKKDWLIMQKIANKLMINNDKNRK
jgi:radical SAM superfamily enzyme YgiQ (UPF0313 family)